MTRKFALCMICLAVLVAGVHFSAFASAEIVVGVKQGDWIEYNVTITGEVPEQHDVTWCRFDVTAVDGKNVYVDSTWRYTNGSEETESKTLKLETGQIGDCFIIPANLDEGDTFLSPEGDITISGVEEKICAGVTRKVVYANNSRTLFHWDRSTGILVEANSSYSEFTLFTKVEKTNMWQTQIFGLDQTVFIALAVLLTVAALASAIFLIRKLRK
jgi:hypothetical protein